jgi:L-ascorbate metabolism protein UlaG (beta-lactamase superfamily)
MTNGCPDVLVAVVAMLPSLGSAPRDERLVRMRSSPRFFDGRFRNTKVTKIGGPDMDVLRAFLFDGAKRVPSAPLPIEEGVRELVHARPRSDLRLTWLGHSTVIVELEGVRLLTDPVWGPRASPFANVGPARFHPPPLALADLPPLDAIVISHDHYDHLDYPTIRALVAGEGGFTGPFITPLGVGAHLEAWGVPKARIVEVDWHDEVRVGDVKVVATPAQHFSGRRALDRNKTLWAGFAFLGASHRVFFSGDTGLTEEHRQIGLDYGPFDVAMFEIGAYHPSWGDIHMGPDNALVAKEWIRAKALLPIHWSTFSLGVHAWAEPIETLWSRAEEKRLLVYTPRIGGSVEPARAPSFQPWWRSVEDALLATT